METELTQAALSLICKKETKILAVDLTLFLLNLATHSVEERDPWRVVKKSRGN